MINIAKLLKDCPKGMKLYSPLFGEVTFKYINNSKFGVVVEDSEGCCRSFDKYGRYFTIYNNAECLLFPSKDYRTWNGWTPCVEPKFKVGNWIVSNSGILIGIINKIKDYSYLVELINGDEVPFIKNCIEQDFHLWTIADAKDGDVLVSGINNPFIYDGNIEFSSAGAYVGVSRDGRIRLDMFPSKAWTSVKDVKPATKEQRDLLFAKLREAGCEWDAEKNEVKKIQSHYDIANFKVGMPVLVRETSLNAWQYVLFSHCYIGGDGLTRFNAGLVGFTQCIPYNDDTKHLLGTTDMPSEEYINW